MSQWDRNCCPEQECAEKGMGEENKKFHDLRNGATGFFIRILEQFIKYCVNLHKSANFPEP